jgi:hypothetical protein
VRIPRACRIEGVVSEDFERLGITNAELEIVAAPRTGRLVASNGKVIAVVDVQLDHGDESGPVSVEALKAARANHRPRSEDPQVLCRATNLKTFGPPKASGPSEFSRPKTVFPPYKGVIPDCSPGDPGTITVGLDAQLLIDLARALGAEERHAGQHAVFLTFPLPERAAGEGKASPTRARYRDAEEGIKVTTDVPGRVGTIMPYKR